MKTKWFLLGLGLVVVGAIIVPQTAPTVIRKLKGLRDDIRDRRLVAQMEEGLRQGLVH